ncbi:MAG TPA: YtxH domain-containing protein [Candidatus Saccharimonadales bacterium]|nr:YtxH domain-containing protein [Candidatus Saccharimonadales bacterium]
MNGYDGMDRKAYIALGVVVGTLAGVGLGILLAPRSGEETRARMRQRAQLAKQKAQEQLAAKREMAMGVLGRGAGRTGEVVEEVVEELDETVAQPAAGRSTATRRRRSAS